MFKKPILLFIPGNGVKYGLSINLHISSLNTIVMI